MGGGSFRERGKSYPHHLQLRSSLWEDADAIPGIGRLKKERKKENNLAYRKISSAQPKLERNNFNNMSWNYPNPIKFSIRYV